MFNQFVLKREIFINIFLCFFFETYFKLNLVKDKCLNNEKFNLLYWSFRKKENFKFNSLVSSQTLKDYKIQLKLAVKENRKVKRIKNLNFKFNYLKNTFFLSKKLYLYSLSFYFYKLLWNYIIKHYPRKKKTWIYQKHWLLKKNKFLFIDINNRNYITFPLFSNKLESLHYVPICFNFFEKK